MKLKPFKIEQYLSKYEFNAPYLLCCSDAESWTMQEIIAMASSEERALWENLHLGYTEVRGLPALRTTIAQELYPELTAENIICFAGAEDAIFCALNVLCTPQDHAIVLTPGYQSLQEIPRAQGCEVTSIPLKEEQGWQIDLDAIAGAIKPNTTLLIMNFPHNPTGSIITPEQLSNLVKLLDDHKIWLFSDEVYRLLGPQNSSWASPAATAYHRGISVGVMSKSLGMAGLRIGWIATQDTMLLNRIEAVKHYTSICNSGPAEILSLIALRNKDYILARNNSIVHHNLELLDQFFDEYKHLFSWVRPQGGCTGFVKYHGNDTIEEFCARLLNEQGVLLLPGSAYDVIEKYFRIGFGRKNMPEALQKLRNFLQKGNHVL